MSTWCVYAIDTGLFTGASFSMSPYSEARAQTHIPPGCAAIEGDYDHLSQRVDQRDPVPVVVDHIPAAPKNDPMRNWFWSAQTGRWIATPTMAAHAAQVRAERDARLAACDWVVARAAELGEPVPPAWRSYRAALRDLPLQFAFPGAPDWPEVPTTQSTTQPTT